MDNLDKLIPQPAELAVGGEMLAIRPLRVGQLPAFLRVISPTLQQLKAPQIDWLGLFIERGDDLLQAVSIAVDKPRAWVDTLAADEAILLAAKVIEVNADFFTRTVLPRLDGLFAQVTQAAVSGSTPSSV
ncbi:peptidase M16 [Ralstonia solanacearum]|nr:peptidase M16 [Ralstonia solanacearum]